MSGRSRGPVRAGEVLAGVLESAGLKDGIERVGVLARWGDLVGETIARVTRAQRVADGTLFVQVRSSPWLAELNMIREEILRAVNEGHDPPLIRRIVFVLDGGSGSTTREGT